ncbi:MAG: OmpR family two-component response regulator [Candidatus Peribacteria bacterium]|nr:OmpR family two-component response regulator [Candidatus Peribacteria bacterium]
MMKTILVAEDEPFLRETIQLGLEEHQVHVIVVSNGDDAVAEIQKSPPDLLLLDLLMPKRDGYSVLAFLRQNSFNFPVIILSNLSDELDQSKCIELGAKDYLVKSDMDEDELWPNIQKYLL